MTKTSTTDWLLIPNLWTDSDLELHRSFHTVEGLQPIKIRFPLRSQARCWFGSPELVLVKLICITWIRLW